jgi:hypothetical protein
MKHFYLILLLALFASMTSNKAIAYDIAVKNDDGVTIYYNWVDHDKTKLSVTYMVYRYSTDTYENEYTGNVSIPSSVTYDGVAYSVTSIGDYAFYGCTGLTSVTIPESVTSIGNYAFRGCSGLTSVTIPESVTSIGYYAFCGCSGLTSVTIPEGVTSIGSCAFENCSSLTSVTIPSSVTSIGGEAFYNTPFYNNQPDGLVYLGSVAYKYKGTMPANTEIVIVDGTVSISSSAFSGCTGLTSVTIPEGVTSIGGSAFSGCSGLTSVTIPEGVTSIGDYAFSGCSGLTSVTLPLSLTSIGGAAFYGCSSLTSVTIPSGVTSIGIQAFYGCSSLTSVTIPSGVTSIGGSAFSGCSGLTSVTIPESATDIGTYAFSGCSGLTSVSIPTSVTKIDDYAFYGCTGLTSVTIGSGVTSIDAKAFSNCTSLNDVYCLAVRYPTTGENVFQGSYPSYVTLHVPDVSVDQYKKKSPWSSFKEVVGLSMSTGTTPCAKPTLSYKKGQIKADCETDGAQCVTIITVDDAGTYTTDGINLSVTYQVSSYAIKPGYACSEVATATLCWIDVEPQASGFTNAIAQVQAHAVLIQSEDGRVSVSGVDDGTAISVYSVDGMKMGAGTCQNGQAVINTNLSSGSIAIVKIGEKSVKVVMR